MKDILYEAAIKYKDMLNKQYHIVLGRKCKTYNIHIKFTMDSFYHLVGLQHLTDITFSTKNKERIYKEILNRKITSQMIKKSVFYEKYFIEERITNLGLIEEILDSCNAVFRINQKEYNKYTRIYADYLCEYKKADEEIEYLYLFLIRDMYSSMEDVYRCCSFFKQHGIDYKRGTTETKLLLIKKIINVDKENEYFVEKFRHPKFLKI